MKKIIIALLMLLLGGSGGYFATTNLSGTPTPSANVFSTTTSVWEYASSTYARSPVSLDWATTTVSPNKRSIYRPSAIDDQVLSGWWVISTTTDSVGTVGTPTRILNSAKGSRKYAVICQETASSTDLFLTNSTTSEIAFGRGIRIDYIPNNDIPRCYTIDDRNLWQGEIYAMSQTVTSTVSITESK